MKNKYIVATALVAFFMANASAGDNKSQSFITGVGTTHFEATRMAYNSARIHNMKIGGASTQKSADGLWHVILKVKSK